MSQEISANFCSLHSTLFGKIVQENFSSIVRRKISTSCFVEKASERNFFIADFLSSFLFILKQV